MAWNSSNLCSSAGPKYQSRLSLPASRPLSSNSSSKTDHKLRQQGRASLFITMSSCHLLVKTLFFTLLLATLLANSDKHVQAADQPGGNNNGCGYPGSPAHASVAFTTEAIETGTIATYTCDNGYELLGPPRRTCAENGTWVPQGIPFCGKLEKREYS